MAYKAYLKAPNLSLIFSNKKRTGLCTGCRAQRRKPSTYLNEACAPNAGLHYFAHSQHSCCAQASQQSPQGGKHRALRADTPLRLATRVLRATFARALPSTQGLTQNRLAGKASQPQNHRPPHQNGPGCVFSLCLWGSPSIRFERLQCVF